MLRRRRADTMSDVFERFTDEARRAVVGAQAEAMALDHNYIGTEHILLGLLRDGSGAASQLLRLFEVPIEDVRQRVEEIIGRGSGAPSGHIPFTPRAKKVLEMSLREALQMGDNYIGSEHVLLGLLREGAGVGAQVLAEQGVTLTAVRGRLGDVERESSPSETIRYMAPRPEPAEPGEDQGEEMIEVPAEHFARLVAEVARLRELLRRHGIDPGEGLPELGEDGEPPVA